MEFEHTYQPGFNRHSPGFKACVDAFKAASKACRGRDLVEYMAARVWPLTSTLFPFKSKRLEFAVLGYEIPCLVFELIKPEGKSDEVIVSDLERAALEVLGPCNRKEFEAFSVVCSHGGRRINRCLTPAPIRRGHAAGNIGSDLPVKI